MSEALTLPRIKPYSGPKLVWIWVGCIVGSWGLAYGLLRLGLSVVGWLGSLLS